MIVSFYCLPMLLFSISPRWYLRRAHATHDVFVNQLVTSGLGCSVSSIFGLCLCVSAGALTSHDQTMPEALNVYAYACHTPIAILHNHWLVVCLRFFHLPASAYHATGTFVE